MSSYSIDVINAHPSTRLKRAVIIDAVRRVFEGELEGVDVAANVILVSDPELHRMNRTHLGHDYQTDVITFRLEDDPLEGEIYISIDRAREQAEEYGVGLYQEVLRLATHGALHLAGYDDATDEEREAMRKLEDHYLGVN
jgi:probable rRNA maturation factor